MTPLLLVALLVAHGAPAPGDGGLPLAIYAEAARLQLTPDAGWVDPPGSGCWEPLPTCLAAGSEFERLKAENGRLKAAPPAAKPFIIVALIGIGMGLAAGAFIGWEAREHLVR